MRTTQFIGLTLEAQNFGDGLTDCSNLFPENVTFGMFDEEIPLCSYRDPIGNIYHEKVQFTVWSSGPMIFTYLQLHLNNKVIVDMFKWKREEYSTFDNKKEFCSKTGVCFI